MSAGFVVGFVFGMVLGVIMLHLEWWQQFVIREFKASKSRKYTDGYQ